MICGLCGCTRWPSWTCWAATSSAQAQIHRNLRSLSSDTFGELCLVGKYVYKFLGNNSTNQVANAKSLFTVISSKCTAPVLH